MSLGGVAHLGERLNGIQEVVGSIPIVSTKKDREMAKISRFSVFLFCEKRVENREKISITYPITYRIRDVYNISQTFIIDMLFTR
jgi:hypothetical protein